MIFIPSASCDSTNSWSNRSINTSRCPGCSVYCRSSTIGQQVCGGCAFGFSTPELCATNETVAIRKLNARKIDIEGRHHLDSRARDGMNLPRTDSASFAPLGHSLMRDHQCCKRSTYTRGFCIRCTNDELPSVLSGQR